MVYEKEQADILAAQQSLTQQRENVRSAREQVGLERQKISQYENYLSGLKMPKRTIAFQLAQPQMLPNYRQTQAKQEQFKRTELPKVAQAKEQLNIFEQSQLIPAEQQISTRQSELTSLSTELGEWQEASQLVGSPYVAFAPEGVKRKAVALEQSSEASQAFAKNIKTIKEAGYIPVVDWSKGIITGYEIPSGTQGGMSISFPTTSLSNELKFNYDFYNKPIETPKLQSYDFAIKDTSFGKFLASSESRIFAPAKLIQESIYAGVESKTKNPFALGATKEITSFIPTSTLEIGEYALGAKLIGKFPKIAKVGLTSFGAYKFSSAKTPEEKGAAIVDIGSVGLIHLGEYGYRRYGLSKELKGWEAQLKAEEPLKFQEYQVKYEIGKSLLNIQPKVKEVSLARLSLLETKPQVQQNLINYFSERPSIIVGGSIGQETQLYNLPSKRPSDIDIYVKSFFGTGSEERRAGKYAYELRDIFRQGGVKNVRVYGTKLQIGKEKIVELHPYSTYLKANIEQATPFWKPAGTGIIKTPKGTKVTRLSIQGQRKLIGGYLEKYSTGKLRLKDIPAAKSIQKSLFKTAKIQGKQSKGLLFTLKEPKTSLPKGLKSKETINFGEETLKSRGGAYKPKTISYTYPEYRGRGLSELYSPYLPKRSKGSYSPYKSKFIPTRYIPKKPKPTTPQSFPIKTNYPFKPEIPSITPISKPEKFTPSKFIRKTSDIGKIDISSSLSETKRRTIRQRPKQPTSYTPSFTALAFNIKGRQPKKLSQRLGYNVLNIRPIIR